MYDSEINELFEELNEFAKMLQDRIDTVMGRYDTAANYYRLQISNFQRDFRLYHNFDTLRDYKDFLFELAPIVFPEEYEDDLGFDINEPTYFIPPEEEPTKYYKSNTSSYISNTFSPITSFEDFTDINIPSYDFKQLEEINCPECGYYGVTRLTEYCPMCGAPIGGFFRRWPGL